MGHGAQTTGRHGGLPRWTEDEARAALTELAPNVRVVPSFRLVGSALALGGRAHGARALLGEVTERYAHLVPNAVLVVANAAQVARESRHDPVTTFSVDPKKLSDLAGAPGRTRTCDQRLRRPLLYPTELRARAMHKLR